MFVCMHVYIYVSLYVSMYVKFVFTHINTYIFARVHVDICVHMHICCQHSLSQSPIFWVSEFLELIIICTGEDVRFVIGISIVVWMNKAD